MKKLLITCILFVLTTNIIVAQSTLLSGKVNDTKQHAVAYASIEVKKKRGRSNFKIYCF